MMAAMYTTYSVVNNSYSQVTDRAKISRSGRDIVEMLMRDIRMAGFRYRLGTNTLDFPSSSYLQFIGGDTTIALSHDPIIIEKNAPLGFSIDGIYVARNYPRSGCLQFRNSAQPQPVSVSVKISFGRSPQPPQVSVSLEVSFAQSPL